jgi:hypothetical protein
MTLAIIGIIGIARRKEIINNGSKHKIDNTRIIPCLDLKYFILFFSIKLNKLFYIYKDIKTVMQ